jgi:two-component system, response regulator
VARDGAEALDYLLGGEAAPRLKLVLLDLKLPLVDGTEVLQRLRADSRTRSLPVVIMTSSREGPDIEKCYKLGANSYIVKPVDFDQFLEVSRQLGLYWLSINQPPPG